MIRHSSGYTFQFNNSATTTTTTTRRSKLKPPNNISRVEFELGIEKKLFS